MMPSPISFIVSFSAQRQKSVHDDLGPMVIESLLRRGHVHIQVLGADDWCKPSILVTPANAYVHINCCATGDSSCELKITILPPPVEQELMEMTVTLTCRVSDAPYDITVSWNHKKEHLDSEIQPTGHADIVESKVNISTRDWLSGDYFECVVSHYDMPTPKTGRINWKKGELCSCREVLWARGDWSTFLLR